MHVNKINRTDNSTSEQLEQELNENQHNLKSSHKSSS